MVLAWRTVSSIVLPQSSSQDSGSSLIPLLVSFPFVLEPSGRLFPQPSNASSHLQQWAHMPWWGTRHLHHATGLHLGGLRLYTVIASNTGSHCRMLTVLAFMFCNDSIWEICSSIEVLCLAVLCVCRHPVRLLVPCHDSVCRVSLHSLYAQLLQAEGELWQAFCFECLVL